MTGFSCSGAQKVSWVHQPLPRSPPPRNERLDGPKRRGDKKHFSGGPTQVLATDGYGQDRAPRKAKDSTRHEFIVRNRHYAGHPSCKQFAVGDIIGMPEDCQDAPPSYRIGVSKTDIRASSEDVSAGQGRNRIAEAKLKCLPTRRVKGAGAEVEAVAAGYRGRQHGLKSKWWKVDHKTRPEVAALECNRARRRCDATNRHGDGVLEAVHRQPNSGWSWWDEVSKEKREERARSAEGARSYSPMPMRNCWNEAWLFPVDAAEVPYRKGVRSLPHPASPLAEALADTEDVQRAGRQRRIEVDRYAGGPKEHLSGLGYKTSPTIMTSREMAPIMGWDRDGHVNYEEPPENARIEPVLALSTEEFLTCLRPELSPSAPPWDAASRSSSCHAQDFFYGAGRRAASADASSRCRQRRRSPSLDSRDTSPPASPWSKTSASYGESSPRPRARLHSLSMQGPEAPPAGKRVPPGEVTPPLALPKRSRDAALASAAAVVGNDAAWGMMAEAKMPSRASSQSRAYAGSQSDASLRTTSSWRSDTMSRTSRAPTVRQSPKADSRRWQ
eukprot:TRINITY_DN40810_c0_g1_i1.p1 TRINITY_DN40810_c0_g1~~TRINITY_DN40810_c0_g1_i1.p1  ORF type:complete len:556 (-),score=101.98 TRINITY_DN40810_c0_g1_i1:153-1820(-)